MNTVAGKNEKNKDKLNILSNICERNIKILKLRKKSHKNFKKK